MCSCYDIEQYPSLTVPNIYLSNLADRVAAMILNAALFRSVLEEVWILAYITLGLMVSQLVSVRLNILKILISTYIQVLSFIR